MVCTSHFRYNKIGGKVKHELRAASYEFILPITNWDLRVASSISRVTSSDIRVTSSNPQVTS